MPTRWAVANGDWSNTATWNSGGTLGIPTGSDDVWANNFNVNINQSFSVISLNNTARSGNAIPLMTANNAPSPYVASAGSVFGAGTEPFRAFNRNNTDWWNSNNGVSASWLSIDLGASNSMVIDSYVIVGSTSQPNNPRNWTFEGSNDNSNWTILHTVSGAAAIANGASYSSPSISNPTSYRYYRVNVSLNGGAISLSIAELELYQLNIANIAAGGSFNFNSGSISGSVTSTTPLSAGATNLITVTATTGSVGLTLGGDISSPGIASSNLISHTGNCNLTISGSIINAANVAGVGTIITINKTSLGNITLNATLRGVSANANTAGNRVLVSSGGNTIINGNVIGPLNPQSNTVLHTISQTVGNITVNGNIVGPSTTNVSNYAIDFSGTSITVNGNVAGGTTAAAINTTAPTLIVGNLSGSAVNAILTTGPVVITGSVIATSAAPAISNASAIFMNISGSVISSATANAISLTNASAVVNLAGNMVNTSGKTAIYCQNLFLSNTATTQAQFFTIGSQDRTLYSADTFPNLPSASNVRFGTTYGPGSGNTGTLRMASPQDVRSGVLTDNTTGSAILSIESLSNEVQTSSDPFAQRLRNIATVDAVGYLLTAFKK